MKTKEQIFEEATKYSEAFLSWGTARESYIAGYEQAHKDMMEREAKLVEALNFYAKCENWYDHMSDLAFNTCIKNDLEIIISCGYGGRRARETLKELGLE